MPGKAIDDEKQRQAQQTFHDEQLLPALMKPSKASGQSYLSMRSICHGRIPRNGMVLCVGHVAFGGWAQTLQHPWQLVKKTSVVYHTL